MRDWPVLSQLIGRDALAVGIDCILRGHRLARFDQYRLKAALMGANEERHAAFGNFHRRSAGQGYFHIRRQGRIGGRLQYVLWKERDTGRLHRLAHRAGLRVQRQALPAVNQRHRGLGEGGAANRQYQRNHQHQTNDN